MSILNCTTRNSGEPSHAREDGLQAGLKWKILTPSPVMRAVGRHHDINTGAYRKSCIRYSVLMASSEMNCPEHLLHLHRQSDR